MERTGSLPCDRLGWLAGLIEGEGWIGLRSPASPRVTVATTDRDVAERLREWSSIGRVVRSRRDTVTGKAVWKWTVTRRDDAAWLLRLILPLMSERRSARITAVLAVYDAAPPTKGTASACGYGHELTPENLRIVDGRRRCLKCQARRQREHRARVAAAS